MKKMKTKLHFINLVLFTLLISSCTSPAGNNYGGQSSGGIMSFLPMIIIIVIVVAIVSHNKNKKENEAIVPSNQTNKIVNVSLVGGLIGLFTSSPQSQLNNRISKENSMGWRVIQIIPADSGNAFLFIFRLLLLIFTLFLYTTANGYYVVMEKVQVEKQTDHKI
jgi:hypothetical protein